MEVFRAIPRPATQWLLMLMIWPLWFILGAVEAVHGGTGKIVQDAILDGMTRMPGEAWGAIIVLGLGAQAYRSYEKKVVVEGAKALTELRKGEE